MIEAEEILKELFSFQRFGIKPGLERTKRLMTFLSLDDLSFRIIHIAGTNGKGAVSSILASILTEAGLKVGLYTSPHILRFNERIKINGREIEDEYIIDFSKCCLEYAKADGCTFFEITTVMCFKYFVDNIVDIAVIETGMGGRFDATNVVNPILSIITNVAKDHQQYLGKGLRKIAYEKAGIIKKGVPVVVGHINKIAKEVIDEVIASVGAVFNSELRNRINIRRYGDRLNITTDKFFVKGVVFPLLGKHQIENLRTALAGIDVICDRIAITSDDIRRGLRNISKNTGYRARIEKIQDNPPIIVDVAHNPDAVKALVRTVKEYYPGKQWQVIFTAMKDKDITKMLRYLLPIATELIIPDLKVERGEKNEVIRKKAEEVLRKEYSNCLRSMKINILPSVREAWDYIRNRNKTTIVVGSFYLVGEVFEYLEQATNISF